MYIYFVVVVQRINLERKSAVLRRRIKGLQETRRDIRVMTGGIKG